MVLIFFCVRARVRLLAVWQVSPCGSAMYVAPEVLGFSGGFMIDWWSLGVLVYELLTGAPPWNTKVPPALPPCRVTARSARPPT